MSNVYFKGDNVFLYVQFTDPNVTDVKVRILHDKGGTIYEDLKWTVMQQMGADEYFYNYKIPFSTDFGQYQVVYSGSINGKLAYVMEVFHVIIKSDKYQNSTKIYGYVNDIKTNVPLSDVIIQVTDTMSNQFVMQSLTNSDGYWESYLYPGDYQFKFKKFGYNDMDISVQIGDEQSEMQFNNIGLESTLSASKGHGVYQIKDKYVTKQGTPLLGLNVRFYNISNPTISIAEDITNNDGEWECFLDSGMYLMKVSGSNLGKDFNKTFRIKVDQDGKYSFDDLSKNVAITTEGNYIDNGKGSVLVTDQIADKNGNPIIDVQVNAFKAGDQLVDSNIIAQDYTDPQGKWKLNLDPGKYVIEYYHPKFKVFTEERTI
jgi:hypothetical protein